MTLDCAIRIETFLERLEFRLNRAELALWVEEGMLDGGHKRLRGGPTTLGPLDSLVLRRRSAVFKRAVKPETVSS